LLSIKDRSSRKGPHEEGDPFHNAEHNKPAAAYPPPYFATSISPLIPKEAWHSAYGSLETTISAPLSYHQRPMPKSGRICKGGIDKRRIAVYHLTNLSDLIYLIYQNMFCEGGEDR
jgi:hypothetical protein